MKRNFLRGILYLILTVFALPMAAQKKEKTVKLCGHVRNSFTRVGINKAKITLMREDSTVVDTMTVSCNNQGTPQQDAYYTFTIPAQKARYIILAQHPDYKDCYVDMTIKYIARNTFFDAPQHYMVKKPMEERDHKLGEVVVKSTKIKMVMRGDTIVYNADAFNLPQGNMLDALIRQLPGAELKENGEIFVNGRKVDYLMLNGKDFFKGDNRVMLDNLPYYTVKNLQVYNRTTDASRYLGRDVQPKEYVMDVKLKKEYSGGFLGNTDLAAGTSKRYSAKLLGTQFTDHTRFTLFANANNINETKSLAENASSWEQNASTGLVSTKAVGMELLLENAEATRKNVLSGKLSGMDGETNSCTTSEAFLSAGNSYGRALSNNRTQSLDVNVKNSFTLMKPFFVFSFSQLTYTDADNNQQGKSGTFQANPEHLGEVEEVLNKLWAPHLSPDIAGIGVNRQMSEGIGTRRNLDFLTTNMIIAKLPWGDAMHYGVNVTYSRVQNKTFSNNRFDYLQAAMAPDNRNQYDSDPRHGYVYQLSAGYSLLLGSSGWAMDMAYQYRQEYNAETALRHRLDRLNGWQAGVRSLGDLPSTRDSMLLAFDLNNSYRRRQWQKRHGIGPTIYYNKDEKGRTVQFSVSFPFSFKTDRMHYQRNLIDTCIVRKNRLFEPSVSWSMSTHEGKYDYRVNLQRTIATPDLVQMVNLKDDMNPLAVQLGNPNLQNTINNNFSMYFGIEQSQRQQTFFLDISGTLTEHAIANGFVYNAQTGGYTFRPENVEGNYSLQGRWGFGRAIDKAKYWSWETSMRYNYVRNVDLTAVAGSAESTKSKVNNHVLNEKLKLQYQRDKLRINLQGTFTWRNANSIRRNFNTINACDYTYGTTVNYTFPLGINLNADLSMLSRRGYGNRLMDTDNLVCNATLSKSFGKERFTARLDAYDLFHQLSNVTYNVNGQGRTEVSYNTIPHYLMLHLVYHINVMPKKKAKENSPLSLF